MDETTSPGGNGMGVGPQVPSPVSPPLLGSAPPPPLPRVPTPAKRRGRGLWIVLTVVLAGLLGLSLLGNLEQLVKSMSGRRVGARHMHGNLMEVLAEDNGSRNKIAVLDVTGIIMGDAWSGGSQSMVGDLEDQFTMAEEDSRVIGVILRVDSPGGEVLASDDIARLVREFQEHSDKPVVASMGGMAASGGYYVSAPCRWIVANELTITGSIGVIMHSYNYRGLLDKVGVRPEVFKSGPYKDMLSGDRTPSEILPEEAAMLNGLIQETFTVFKKVVREGRAAAHEANGTEGRNLASDWESYADGRILSGRQAFELGFVDELGGFDAAVDRCKQLAGVESANLVSYQRPFELGNLLRLWGTSEGRAVKLDLGLELPKLQAGRPYFLIPTVVR